MNRKALAGSAVLLLLAVVTGLHGQAPPAPSPQQPSPRAPAVRPAPGQPPAPAARQPRPRGARRSPPHKLLMTPQHPTKRAIPASYVPRIPAQLSMWGNDTYGDCVTAEECFAKAFWATENGYPEVFVPEQTAVQWARRHGFLNGADLTSVMDAMIGDGIAASDGKTYHDGPYHSVNWQDWSNLTSAISTGPVKIAVAADQLENVVTDTNGWTGHGFRRDQLTDHCVQLPGYGTWQQLCAPLGVAVPAGVDPNGQAVYLSTWGTVGIVGFADMVAITDEAWVRSPTTPEDPPQPTPGPTPAPTPGPTPGPTPQPTPGPTPGPTPAPTPGGWSGTITISGGQVSRAVPDVTPGPTPPTPAFSGTLKYRGGLLIEVSPSAGTGHSAIVLPPDWKRRQASGPAVTIHPQIRAADVPAGWDVRAATGAAGMATELDMVGAMHARDEALSRMVDDGMRP